LIGPSQQNRTIGVFSKYKFILEDEVVPFGPPIKVKYENFGQNMCDKSVLLLGKSWGTH